MRSWWVGAVALAGAGCGWLPDLPSLRAPAAASNRGACEAWVTQVNGLDGCVHVTYDPANVCEGADLLPPEMATYYRCLTETAHCEGEDARLAPPKCVAPLVALGVAATENGP